MSMSSVKWSRVSGSRVQRMCPGSPPVGHFTKKAAGRTSVAGRRAGSMTGWILADCLADCLTGRLGGQSAGWLSFAGLASWLIT